jgi:hypothetical protein
MPDESRPFGELEGMRLVVGGLDREHRPEHLLLYSATRNVVSGATSADLSTTPKPASCSSPPTSPHAPPSPSPHTTFIHDKDDSTRPSH